MALKTTSVLGNHIFSPPRNANYIYEKTNKLIGYKNTCICCLPFLELHLNFSLTDFLYFYIFLLITFSCSHFYIKMLNSMGSHLKHVSMEKKNCVNWGLLGEEKKVIFFIFLRNKQK